MDTRVMKVLLAQRLEQRTHNPLVVGSNPTGPTKSSCACVGYYFLEILLGIPGEFF